MSVKSNKSLRESLLDEMEFDSEISETNLQSESLKTMSIYTKYQRKMVELSHELVKEQQKFNKIKKELTDYYLGRLPDEAYKDKPKQQKILKTDLDIYLKADEDYQKAEAAITEVEILITTVDNFLKQVSGRNFAIKNSIDVMKFNAGGYQVQNIA